MMWSFNLICAIFITFSIFSTEGKDVTLMKKKKNDFKQKLVYGGLRYKITDAPYMALLYYKIKSIEIFNCGACIVHERFLLTAAHCYEANYQSFVKVGTDVIDGGIKYDIEKMIVHPRYNIGAEVNNDIAVIKLRTKLNFNERVLPIEMAPKNIVIESGAVMQTMGFGRTERSNTSRHLLIIKVPLVPQYDCMSKYNGAITNSMLCAGGVNGMNSCSGDSGGPLVYKNKLVGLVSFGNRICSKEVPVVYASIPALRGFVDYTIKVELFKDQVVKNVFKPRCPNYPSFVKVGTDVIDGGIKYNIEKIIVHPRYNVGVEANNDIAVIKLRTKLNFNGRVNLIEMASKAAIEPDAVMQTMGFGRTEKSESSRHLLIVQVPYVPQYVCQSKLKMLNAIITNSMLCAGGVKGKDSCNGDSGGPLVYRSKLFGLVSFGYECGEELPAVYASIPALRDFVDYTISVESYRDIYNRGVANIFHRPWW